MPPLNFNYFTYVVPAHLPLSSLPLFLQHYVWTTKTEFVVNMFLLIYVSLILLLLSIWMWRPTSPGNEDVLICINAPFMTQHVLKPWWPWTYQNSAIKRASARAIPGWVTFWEVWFGGAKSGQYCVIVGGSLQMVLEPLPSLRWWERAQAQWRTPAGMLGPKRGWLWRPTSPENEDVFICINAHFMTQRVLKPWWLWTYQNSTVKRAFTRAIPGWVTSWEVWFDEPKADNIVSLEVGRYNG
jgi:hypothetical protein